MALRTDRMRTIYDEGLIIPPVKVIERGEIQKPVLDLIFNNMRMPAMNRADMFALIAGCRAGEKRVQELCERFGKETYLAACQALLDRTHAAMKTLINLAIPEADDLAGGRPRLLRLDRHGSAGDGPGELLPLRGDVQDVHRGLPDHGQRPPDPVQRRVLPAAAHHPPGGLPAEAALPVGAAWFAAVAREAAAALAAGDLGLGAAR